MLAIDLMFQGVVRGMRRNGSTASIVAATLAGVVIFMSPARVFAQPTKETGESEPHALAKRRADEAVRIAQKHAEQYDVYSDPDRKTRLVLHARPVLRWTNPVPQETGGAPPEVYGGVFVWTLNKRPLVVASIFKWYSPYTHVDHELLSLSSGRVIADRDSETQWRPSSGGVSFKLIPKAPRPASSRRARDLQIRTMARQFSAEKIDDQDNRTRLRLLAQPLYEFEAEESGVLGGALLAFAEGTDPEMVLLIEARKSGDEFRWHYAAGRLNHLRLRLYHRTQELWSQPVVPYSESSQRTGTYSYLKQEAGD
jgi:hypothetical protein